MGGQPPPALCHRSRVPPLLAFFRLANRLFFEHRKLNLLLHRIDTVQQNAKFLSQAVDLARTLPNDLSRVLVKGVAVVRQTVQRDQSLNKQIGKLHKESKLGDAGDEAIEVFADAVLHELGFLSLHQLPLGIAGAPLGPARLFGNLMQFLQPKRATQGFERLPVSGVVASFGPRGRRWLRSAAVSSVRWRIGSSRPLSA